MGFFNDLEENLEKYIERFFKTKSRDHIEPVDIARAMAREMRRSRRAGLKGVYVPNRYEILLGEQDYRALEALLDSLASELNEYITEKAAEKKYLLAGPVTVEFAQCREDDENRGHEERLVVRGYYDQLPVEGREQETKPGDTLRFTPVRFSGQPAPVGRVPKAVLEKAAGYGGEQYVLDGEYTSIGRRGTCDICLSDAGVSRKHAVITRRGERYIISDQSSTNGTYVNGRKITRQVLESGDVIKIGGLLFTFKVV